MAKGSSSDPYTMAEYDKMVKDGTWKGGHVKDDQGNVSYTMAELVVNGYSGSGKGSGSGSGSDFQFGSYKSFQGDPGLDDDDDDDDDDDNDDRNKNKNPGNGDERPGDDGNTGGGGGGSSSWKKSFPTPPKKIDKAGVRVYSKRIYKTSVSTLSCFTAVAYNNEGSILSGTKLTGYFLERVIDYDKAEVSGSNTAIRKGEYKIIPQTSGQKFKWYLENVPGRAGVAIHTGNYYTDCTGCLLTGTSYSYDSSEKAYVVGGSKAKADELFDIFDRYGKNNIFITITESF